MATKLARHGSNTDSPQENTFSGYILMDASGDYESMSSGLKRVLDGTTPVTHGGVGLYDLNLSEPWGDLEFIGLTVADSGSTKSINPFMRLYPVPGGTTKKIYLGVESDSGALVNIISNRLYVRVHLSNKKV